MVKCGGDPYYSFASYMFQYSGNLLSFQIMSKGEYDPVLPARCKMAEIEM